MCKSDSSLLFRILVAASMSALLMPATATGDRTTGGIMAFTINVGSGVQNGQVQLDIEINDVSSRDHNPERLVIAGATDRNQAAQAIAQYLNTYLLNEPGKTDHLMARFVPSAGGGRSSYSCHRLETSKDETAN